MQYTCGPMNCQAINPWTWQTWNMKIKVSFKHRHNSLSENMLDYVKRVKLSLPARRITKRMVIPVSYEQLYHPMWRKSGSITSNIWSKRASYHR